MWSHLGSQSTFKTNHGPLLMLMCKDKKVHMPTTEGKIHQESVVNLIDFSEGKNAMFLTIILYLRIRIPEALRSFSKFLLWWG